MTTTNIPSPPPAAAAPNLAQALAEALALHQQGNLSEAERRYTAILSIKPDHPDALHFLGLVKFAQGQAAEALSLIAAAIRSARSPQMFLNYGIVLNALNRNEEAIESFGEAIKLAPDFFDAHNSRGVLLAALGRNEEALADYRKALALVPNSAEIVYNLGNVLNALGRHQEALASYERAIAIEPAHAEALCNRGTVLETLERFEDALASYDRALALRPDLAEAHRNRGNALIELKRYDAALAAFDRALTLHPDDAELLSNKSAVLLELKRYAEALASNDRALSLAPDHVDALCNRGTILNETMRQDEALATLERALTLAPDMPKLHWNVATVSLLKGDLTRGFTEYEWRWKKDNLAKTLRPFPQPLWRGDGDIAGKTILLHSEQGFGDTLQFCRYAKLVAARGARVILEVERPLVQLLTILEGPSQVIAKGEPLPNFDLHCPLMSLPLACGTRLETIPAEGAYLKAPDGSAWRERLANLRRPAIGLVWSGNPTHHRDHERSASFTALAPLLDASATFVSLQKQPRPADAALLAARPDILRFGEEPGDFADTAALIAELDLVITVDTSVAHLAGALGKPVWILLQYLPDWRWQLSRADSPWYPTARLFRQNETRRWDGVIADVDIALREFLDRFER